MRPAIRVPRTRGETRVRKRVWSKYSNAQRISSLHLSKGCLNLPWCTTPIEAESSLGPDSHHPIISLSGIPSAVMVLRIWCLRCLLLVMCTHPFAKKALTLHLARGEGRERYFGCNLMQRKVLASSHQHLMAEAPVYFKRAEFWHRTASSIFPGYPAECGRLVKKFVRHFDRVARPEYGLTRPCYTNYSGSTRLRVIADQYRNRPTILRLPKMNTASRRPDRPQNQNESSVPSRYRTRLSANAAKKSIELQ